MAIGHTWDRVTAGDWIILERVHTQMHKPIEHSFGMLWKSSPPASIPRWTRGVYGKELSSFVFYTGTRSITNDAHGSKKSAQPEPGLLFFEGLLGFRKIAMDEWMVQG